jgi:hypothetical protein
MEARMGWIGNPIFILTISAATMVACVLLFLSLKRENAALRRRAQLDHELLSEQVETFRRSLNELQSALAERVEATPVAVSPAPGRSMNISKRSQALRLHRRGESSGTIAATLRLPLNEVELLLKVHRTVIGSL